MCSVQIVPPPSAMYMRARRWAFRLLPAPFVRTIQQMRLPRELKLKVRAMNLKHSPRITMLGSHHYFLWPCLSEKSIVYSFGLERNPHFELTIHKECGAQIWMFDPTSIAVDFVKSRTWPAEISFVPVGVADYDGEATFYEGKKTDGLWESDSMFRAHSAESVQLPVRRISTLMGQLGHQSLDVLKLDIEGAEYAVLEDICREQIDIGQIVVEFHDYILGCHSTYAKTLESLGRLQQMGYRVLWHSHTHQEMSLVKESSIFRK